jgi:L-alanine-DL-glutamate epimerase-like enolase superfamily enzyme
MVEYLIQHQEAKQFFHRPIYRPFDGLIYLPELPGLGLVLDQEKIVDRREID